MMISLNREQWIVAHQLIGWLKSYRSHFPNRYHSLSVFIDTLEELIPMEAPRA